MDRFFKPTYGALLATGALWAASLTAGAATVKPPQQHPVRQAGARIHKKYSPLADPGAYAGVHAQAVVPSSLRQVLGDHYRANVRDWEKDHEIYLQRLPESRAKLEAYRTNTYYAGPVHVREWHKLVDLLKGEAKSLPLKTKLQMVNDWVNAIPYDLNKADPSKRDDYVIWYQTPLESLERGTLICGDAARLKAETLRAGHVLPAKDMRFAIEQVNIGKIDYHQELEVFDPETNKYYMLNNNTVGLQVMNAGGLESPEKHIAGGGFGYKNTVPLASEAVDKRGTKVYDTAKVRWMIAQIKKGRRPIAGRAAPKAQICDSFQLCVENLPEDIALPFFESVYNVLQVNGNIPHDEKTFAPIPPVPLPPDQPVLAISSASEGRAVQLSKGASGKSFPSAPRSPGASMPTP